MWWKVKVEYWIETGASTPAVGHSTNSTRGWVRLGYEGALVSSIALTMRLTISQKIQVKSSIAISPPRRSYYHCLHGQLSTTLVKLLYYPNGQLLIIVDPNQLRTMASETVDLIGTPPLAGQFLPEHILHSAFVSPQMRLQPPGVEPGQHYNRTQGHRIANESISVFQYINSSYHGYV